MSNEYSAFLVTVSETFTKQVIIWAPDEETAYAGAEELCNQDEIDATDGGDMVRVIDVASSSELHQLPQYEVEVEE